MRLLNRILIGACVVLTQTTLAQSPKDLILKEEEIRQQMISWSKELGITCTECHNPKNFKDNSLKNFKVAQDHQNVVMLIRKNGFDGLKYPQANCYMCHQGQLKPVTKSKF